MRYTAAALAFLLISQSAVEAVSTINSVDFNTMFYRRISDLLVDATVSSSSANKWSSALLSNGTWSDVDYTAGCTARLSNWPTIQHLIRTAAVAAEYTQKGTDTTLLNNSLRALNYWLDNDWTASDCLQDGGSGNCPCGTPGLWNKNWFDQVIAVPQWIGNICMLLRDELTSAQKTSCTTIQHRAFIVVSEGAGTMSPMTGANLLDVSSVGINLGLFNNDTATLATALNAFYSGVVISDKVAGDGIQADGSFMQHLGLLYTGNYGKDYINDLLNVFVETAGTNLEPSVESQQAFVTLMQGTEWMMVGDSKLQKLLWQYSTIGRMISFRYSDGQASGGVDIDVNEIEESGEAWSDHAIFENITDRLSLKTTDANQGSLTGTRYFYNADYMVHRAPNYVTTFKMYSSRTVNSECLNVQNPFGFHLSDGSIYTYQTGDEYVDVFGVWNWDLVPGITVDVQGTPLTCSTVKKTGKQNFVGGATDGNTGIAVLDYLNPINGNLHFKKTAFFFPSGYAVQLGPVTSLNTTAELVTVLDQRRRNGDIYVSNNLKNTNTTYLQSSTNSVWHDSMGYYFPTAENIYVDSKPRNANWSSFGISSGTESSQLFTSYIKHASTTTTGLLTQYIVQPQISQSDFADSVSGGMPISLAFQASKPQVNAAFSAADKSLGMAFWSAGTFTTPWNITVTSNTTCIFMFRETEPSVYRLTAADPSQKLSAVKLTFVVNSVTASTTVSFPTGTKSGRYAVKSISFK